MNTMKGLVWLLPLLFILHDMEEIIFVRAWKEREGSLKKYCLRKFVPFGTMKGAEDCAIGVYEELLILCIVSGVSYVTNWYGLWFGMLAANTLHLLLIHMIGSIAMYHRYVPGVVTAYLTILPCAYLLVQSQKLLGYGVVQVIGYAAVCILTGVINLNVLHKNAYRFHVR